MLLIRKAIMLLGRIVEYQNFVPFDAEPAQRADEYIQLQSTLTHFWVSLPPSISKTHEAPLELLPGATQLSILLHTSSVLFNFPTSVCGKKDGLLTSLGIDCADQMGFQRAYASVKSIVDVIRHTAGVSVQSLINPLLAPSYFLCCRFLVERWHQTKEQSHQLDLDLLVGLFDRISSTGVQETQEMKRLVIQDIQRSTNGHNL